MHTLVGENLNLDLEELLNMDGDRILRTHAIILFRLIQHYIWDYRLHLEISASVSGQIHHNIPNAVRFSEFLSGIWNAVTW